MKYFKERKIIMKKLYSKKFDNLHSFINWNVKVKNDILRGE